MSVPLFSLVDRGHLSNILETFHACVDLPVQLIDVHGTVLERRGGITGFCGLLEGYFPAEEACARLHAKASQKAMELGESYIFACHAGLSHIAFPLRSGSACFGGILAGPFLLQAPDALLIQDIARKYPVPTASLIDLYEQSTQLKVVSPQRARHISSLLTYLFSGLIEGNLALIRRSQDLLSQQARISESIQMYKSQEVPQPLYPYETERELISKVKTGNVHQAKALLNDLLGYVLFSQGNSLETIKLRALELSSLLSRAAIEGGAVADSTLRMNNRFLNVVQGIATLEQLCYQLQQMVEYFCDSLFPLAPTRHSELVKRATQYIAQHFSQPLTLENVANHVHLNPAYFSTLFKQHAGCSFKAYLNLVRIEEGKRLLSSTDYSIIDIAVAVGYETQSYFSKVFKRMTGLTPKQFRG